MLLPVTIILTITLRRLGNDFRKPMIEIGVIFVLVGVSIITFFTILCIMSLISAMPIYDIESIIPIRG